MLDDNKAYTVGVIAGNARYIGVIKAKDILLIYQEQDKFSILLEDGLHEIDNGATLLDNLKNRYHNQYLQVPADESYAYHTLNRFPTTDSILFINLEKVDQVLGPYVKLGPHSISFKSTETLQKIATWMGVGKDYEAALNPVYEIVPEADIGPDMG